ncbi:MAG: DUF2339 domain-containing protein [Planctomycetota bacterium]|nr:DUF2339 domain-containing protein [Planctomycetota bacterium]
MDQEDLRWEIKRLAERVARLEAQIEAQKTSGEEHSDTSSKIETKPVELSKPPVDVSETTPPAHLTSDLIKKKHKLQSNLETTSTEGVSEPFIEKTTIPKITEPPESSTTIIPPLQPPKAPPPVITSVEKPVPKHPVQPPIKTKEDRKTPIEMIIGGQWMAWIGAAAVFAAALFAIRIAIDNGWWGMLTPLAKFLSIATGGLLLTIGGEVVYRKIGRVASIGLFSAGLGVLYLDCFATFRYWDLFSKEWAFVLMGLVAIGGFALTYRAKTLTIGILTIVGGFLTPVLLRGQTQHDVEMLSFLTMLLGISLGLAGVQPKTFGPLRFVALGWLCVVGLGWLLANGPTHWVMGIIFMSIWWTMVLGEAVFAALREHSMRGNIVMTLLATIGFVTGGCWVLSAGPTAGTDWIGIFTAMIAVLACVVAIHFGPGIDGLRIFPRRAMDKLAVALWVQAGILIASAVALHFDDAGRAVGWLVVGLGAIETGRRLPSKGLDIFGLVVGALALFDVAFVCWWVDPTLNNVITQWGDLEITGWSILAMVAILTTSIAAQRINNHWPNNWKIAPIVLASLATIGWVGWWLAQAVGILVTIGWLLGIALLLVLHRRGMRQRCFELAQLLLLYSATRWATVDLVRRRFESDWDPFRDLPILNSSTALALAIASLGWWVQRILKRRERDESFHLQHEAYWFQVARQLAVLFIVGITVLALSFDIDRIVERMANADKTVNWVVGHVRQNLITLLWSVGALVLGLLAHVTSRNESAAEKPQPRLLFQASTILLCVCTLKWLLFDTLSWIINPVHDGVGTLVPLLNVQMLTGLVLAISGMLLRRQIFTALKGVEGVKGDGGWRDPAAWMPVLASLVLLWGASFEVDRMLGRAALANEISSYTPALLRALWWTGLWATGGLVMTLIGFWRHQWLLIATGFWLIVMSTLAWLTFDTVGWRFWHDALDVRVIFNLQFIIGLTVAIMLRGSEWVNRQLLPNLRRMLYGDSNPINIVHGLIAILGLWLGTLELDRLFADDITIRLASFSVYWGLYGVALVAYGFIRSLSIARYAGLALLAITASKVLFIDMAEAKNIWRVVSFGACGLLFIGTSIAYSKMGQLLLDEETEDTTNPPEEIPVTESQEPGATDSSSHED